MLLEGDPIILYLDKDQYDRRCTKCMRRFLCVLVDNRRETTFLKYELSKKPITCYLILHHLNQWQSFSNCSRLTILFAIFFATALQFGVSIIFFIVPVGDLFAHGLPPWNYVNIIAAIFILIYIVKEYSSALILLYQIAVYRDDDKKKKYGDWLIYLYLILSSSAVTSLYLSATLRILLTEDGIEKMEVGVGVFFVLELDEWIYHLVCEPMTLFGEELFTVYIQQYGTLREAHDYQVRVKVFQVVLYVTVSMLLIGYFSRIASEYGDA